MAIDVKRYEEDIAREIGNLVRIPSVETPALPGMPFGKGCAEVLEAALALGRSLGFETLNVDNYAGHIEYGSGPETIAVLCHLDVVPEGEGWDTPPFSGIIQDGKVLGRGSADNKGPAVASLYAIKALADAGIMNPNMKIRLILGCNEESGMACMTHYFSKQPLPAFGFSPDAGYPACNREKGILRFDFVSAGEDAGIRLEAGRAYNSVPDKCVLTVPGTLFESMTAVCASYADAQAVVERVGDDVQVTLHGQAAHAARPDAGKNAALHMLRMLGQSEVRLPERMQAFATFLRDKIGLECSGAAMGVAMEDEPSGDLTLSVGMLHMGPEGCRACVDIRYPVTADGQEIIDTLTKAAQAAGIEGVVNHHSEPLYVPEDHPMLQKLLKAYTKVTGLPGTTYAMGGGTYARSLKGNGVAFGPGLPDVVHESSGGGAHQANECVWIEDMVKHAEICAATLAELLG